MPAPTPVITTIPAAVWRSMTGRSWHAGCPVGRSGLRLLRINYWGFDGYRYRGEMVLSAAVARRAAAALRDMYNGHYPIRRMYRVDRFGWSKRRARRQRLRVDASRQHLGVQLPQRREQAVACSHRTPAAGRST